MIWPATTEELFLQNRVVELEEALRTILEMGHDPANTCMDLIGHEDRYEILSLRMADVAQAVLYPKKENSNS